MFIRIRETLMKNSILNKKNYRGVPIWEQGTAYALCSAISDNIHILKKDMNGNYCIANETKIKGVTIEDLAFYYAIGRAYALGFRTEINHKLDPDIIAEDGFVTLYTKSGRPYPHFFDDLSEKERAKLDEKPVTGGSYDYVKYCADSSVYDVHHIISVEAIKATGFLNFNKAPCIRILKSDHILTESFGSYAESSNYRKKQIELIKQGRISELIQEEVNFIHLRFGSKYDKELEEMLKYVKKLETNNWEIRNESF